MSIITDLPQSTDVVDDDLLLKRDTSSVDDEKVRADTLADYINSRLGSVAGSGLLYVTGGTASVQTVSMIPALTAYATDLEITAQAGTPNDGAFTLDVDGNGPVSVKLLDGSDPYAGAFSGIGKFRYDGTNFVLLNPATPFHGALVSLTANESISNNTNTYIPWDQSEYDTDGFWSAGNPTRLTVQRDGYVMLFGNVQWVSDSSGFRKTEIEKLGGSVTGGGSVISVGAGGTAVCIQEVNSAPLPVVAGDYFEIEVNQNSGSALNINVGERTFFGIQVVG